jgi:hypothetical protein
MESISSSIASPMLAYPKSHLGKPQESTRHGDSDTKLTGHGVDTNDDQAQVDHLDQDFLANLARQPTDQSVDPSDHGRTGIDNQDHFEQCHLDRYDRVRQSDRTILNGSELSPLSFTANLSIPRMIEAECQDLANQSISAENTDHQFDRRVQPHQPERSDTNCSQQFLSSSTAHQPTTHLIGSEYQNPTNQFQLNRNQMIRESRSSQQEQPSSDEQEQLFVPPSTCPTTSHLIHHDNERQGHTNHSIAAEGSRQLVSSMPTIQPYERTILFLAARILKRASTLVAVRQHSIATQPLSTPAGSLKWPTTLPTAGLF